MDISGLNVMLIEMSDPPRTSLTCTSSLNVAKADDSSLACSELAILSERTVAKFGALSCCLDNLARTTTPCLFSPSFSLIPLSPTCLPTIHSHKNATKSVVSVFLLYIHPAVVSGFLHCSGNVSTHSISICETEVVYRKCITTHPMYALICQYLFQDSHTYKITLQYWLWNFLPDFGEVNVGGEEVIKNMKGDDGRLEVRSISSSRMKNTAEVYYTGDE